MKAGIIFDMDGTLWDSSDQVAVSWNETVKKHGYHREELTAADMQAVMGKTMDVLSKILFPNLPDDRREELLYICGKEENEYLKTHGGTLYPGLQKTLEALKEKYHLYIVSNCQSGYMEAFLDYYRFHNYFEDIECYGNNKKSKGENIALICRRNHLDDAVYVGDIQGDYEASKEAGIKFIHAAYGFGTIDDTVPEIHSLPELTDIVDRIFSV